MTNKQFKLTFLGGAGTVTGSKILIETLEKRVLVDCGLFQGLKELRLQNWKPFPIEPQSIDSLILTHAHLDHCGYIPLLVKNGFRGKIYCTRPTRDLTEIILLDSAKISEEDAERANSHAYTKHKKAEPLYQVSDVHEAMAQFEVHDLHEWVFIDSQIKFQFQNSGHILGSAFIEMKIHGRKVIFSGDIGREKPLLLYPPQKINEADYIILESTYGDRVHEIENVKEQLLEIIDETFKRKGILLIPSFAVERTQELIFLMHELIEEDRMPKISIYLDSPMGINSSLVYTHYASWQNLSHYDISRMYNHVKFINNFQQSKTTVLDKHPKIVIAGSGMLEGGRILHYLNNHVENEQNTLLFMGYQGEGTRGRAIMEGSQEIKFFGAYKKVKCQIKSISSLSAHADQNEMVSWLKNFTDKPKAIFLNHGESHQTDALRVKIKHELDWEVKMPEMNESFILQ